MENEDYDSDSDDYVLEAGNGSSYVDERLGNRLKNQNTGFLDCRCALNRTVNVRKQQRLL